MKRMFSHTPLLLGALYLLGSFSSAHHMLTNIYINGVDQGDGNSIRVPPNTNPITNIKSPEMACNVGGEKPLNKFVSLDAGARVTFQWRTWPDGSQNTPIDVSHQGPCAVYMKRVTSFASVSAQGAGWFKIWHDGYSDGQFCTERLRSSGGLMNATIPKDLEGGHYLIRAEHLALHQAQDIGGAQWYIGCVQAAVFSTGGSARPPGVSIPGHVSANDPGVHYDYWNNMHPKSYTIPGPGTYTVTAAGGGSRIKADFPEKYPVCVVSNADWCAVPVQTYTNEAKCWSASGNCWEQLSACYDTAPATGHKGCTRWNTYCEAYQEQCNSCGATRSCSGKFTDPPAESPRLRTRSERDKILLPPIPKRAIEIRSLHHKRHAHQHAHRAAVPEPEITIGADKLTQAHSLCAAIHKNCSKRSAQGICRAFAKACRDAIQPNIIEQLPDKSDRKWQALWLYQVVCTHEGLGKDACRESFSEALEGFE